MKKWYRYISMFAVLALMLSMVPSAFAADPGVVNLNLVDSVVDGGVVSYHYNYTGYKYFSSFAETNPYFKWELPLPSAGPHVLVNEDDSSYSGVVLYNYFIETSGSAYFNDEFFLFPVLEDATYLLQSSIDYCFSSSSLNNILRCSVTYYDSDFTRISSQNFDNHNTLPLFGTFSFSQSLTIPAGTCYFRFSVMVNSAGLQPGETFSLSCDSFDLYVMDEYTPPDVPRVIVRNDFHNTIFVGDPPPSLNVSASVDDDGVLSYQWYSGTSLSDGVPIPGATSSVYHPGISSDGFYSFFCEVTNTLGYFSTSVISDYTVIVVSPPIDSPSSSLGNPSSYDHLSGSGGEYKFYVDSSVSDGGKLSYQWYFGSGPDNGLPIVGATSDTFIWNLEENDTTLEDGTYYVWCEVTNTNSYGITSTSKSDATTITFRSPTVDDITYNWGSSPVYLGVGEKLTLHVNVPAGLFDSYTIQWYRVVNSFYTQAIDGATSTGFQVPTDEEGVFKYQFVITGQDGNNTVTTMGRTCDFVVSSEYNGSGGSDEETGISWNWENPIRLEQGDFRALSVNIPSSIDGYYVQWYLIDTDDSSIAIPDANQPFLEVPADQVGQFRYMMLIRFKDGSTKNIYADVVVVESENYGSTSGSGGSGNTGSTGSTVIDTSGFFKPTAKNNLDLVEWVKRAYSNGWGYVMGTYGEVLTEELLAYKLGQYPDAVSPYEEFIRSNWLNKRAADCVGLIKSYCWYDPSDGSIKYATNDTPDYSADQMFNWCEETGTIDTLPEIPGLLLWKSGHVGVYIGGGYVIEARGTYYGVIKSVLGDGGWSNWGKIPSINYLNTDDVEKDNTLSGIWAAIKNIPQKLLDGIVSLFVPSQEDMVEYADKWDALLASRFGAVWESLSLAGDLIGAVYEPQPTIQVPSVTVDLAGTDFTFGGWTVDVIPEGFEFLQTVSKTIVNLVATLAFFQGLKRRLGEIMGIDFRSVAGTGSGGGSSDDTGS